MFSKEYYRATGADRFHRKPRGRVDPAAVRRTLTHTLPDSARGDPLGDVPNGIVYLEDELTVLTCSVALEAAGGCEPEARAAEVRVFGSPWQPEFCDWAFNLERGQPCRDAWAKIPARAQAFGAADGASGGAVGGAVGDVDSGGGVDVLLTHGPPLGRGDMLHPSKGRSGCVPNNPRNARR